MLCTKKYVRTFDIINYLVLELPNKSQAALPQGIVPFVFAKEYNVHPDILSTGSVHFLQLN